MTVVSKEGVARRLRDASHDVINGLAGIKQVDAMIAGATRIESLEIALDKIAMTEFSDAWVDQQASMAWAHCCFIAREALESAP